MYWYWCTGIVIFETTLSLSEQQLSSEPDKLLTQPSTRRSLWGCVQTDNSTVRSNQRRRWFQWGYCVGTVGGQTERAAAGKKKHATQCDMGVAVLAIQICASCTFLLLLCISVYLATQIKWLHCTETLKRVSSHSAGLWCLITLQTPGSVIQTSDFLHHNSMSCLKQHHTQATQHFKYFNTGKLILYKLKRREKHHINK